MKLVALRMFSKKVKALFVLVLGISTFSQAMPKTVGPEITGRAKLMRDHLIPKVLSKAARPPHKPRNRTLINMSLTIRSIDLEVPTGLFKTDGYMALTWNDPRYTWEPADYSGETSIPLPFSDSWAPEVILHNAVEEKFIYRQVGELRHNGDLVYLVSIHTKSGCKPNFEDDVNGGSFPFNVQTCSLRFGSWINELYNVEYRLASASDPGKADINLDEFNSPTGWQVLATKAELESIHYPLFDEPSRLVVFTFSFKRSIFYDPMSGILWKEEDSNNRTNPSVSTISSTTTTPRGDQNEF